MLLNKKLKIAINGFGRIGRATFKVLLEKNMNVVAINDLTDTKTLAHLLKYDSCYGIYGYGVSHSKDSITVNKKKYAVFAEKDPKNLPWKELGVDVVIESTGKFRDVSGCQGHLEAGAKKVIISAPTEDSKIKTIVLGVNEKDLKKSDHIFSMASCTTNCLAPVTAVIKEKFGIKKAIMSTIHSYTADQSLVDGPHKDLRRARAAAVNIVPTTTGAAIAATMTIPSLKNKFDGLSFRVPTPIVSLCDAVILTGRKVTAEEVNEVLKKVASDKNLKTIIEVSNEPLVSSDLIGNPHSAIVDLALTKVVDGDLLKIISWYDNEWGYSNRLVDLCMYIQKNIL